MSADLGVYRLDTFREIAEQGGYVLILAASHKRAQQRQHVAEVRLADAHERIASLERAIEHEWDGERKLRRRCEYLYGLAARKGASDLELRGGSA